MKPKPLKKAQFYWTDTLFILHKVPSAGRNAQVQTALEIYNGPLQLRLGYRS